MNIFSKLLFSAAVLGGLTRAGLACDSCALYVAEGADRPGWTLSVAQQFTRFGTMWSGDQRLGNPAGQYLDSSITQLAVGYGRGGPWSVQFTLPLVTRSYQRPDHALSEIGHESGWGDATLAVRYRLWQQETDTSTLEFNLLGGVKFATGDATHLGDELSEPDHQHSDFPESGIHSHDLALGSGSTDGVLGVDAGWRHGRVFLRGSLQYQLRRPGKFDYRLADETAWEAGPGCYVLLKETRSLAVQALFSAEHKGLDTLAGEPQDDTGFNARYLGGRITGTCGDFLVLAASVELPVRLRTTETMVVPDYRLRASVTWRF